MARTYIVIGSPGQVAAVDFLGHGGLTLARRICAPARFSTGAEALVAANMTWRTKGAAQRFKLRCDSRLAYLSGRLGRWIIPTFVTTALHA